jgi:hypothetical protein
MSKNKINDKINSVSYFPTKDFKLILYMKRLYDLNNIPFYNTFFGSDSILLILKVLSVCFH